MWNPPTKKQLAKIPKLGAQEDKPIPEKKVYMKFFLGGWTWLVTEYDGKDKFFGMVYSPMMPEGELGYFSLSELKNIRVKGMEVDRDMYDVTVYSPKKIKELR